MVNVATMSDELSDRKVSRDLEEGLRRCVSDIPARYFDVRLRFRCEVHRLQVKAHLIFHALPT